MIQAFYVEKEPGSFELVAAFNEDGQIVDECCLDGLDTLERFRQDLETTTLRAMRVMEYPELAGVPLRL